MQIIFDKRLNFDHLNGEYANAMVADLTGRDLVDYENIPIIEQLNMARHNAPIL